MKIVMPGSFYRQYDADYSRDVPAEGFQGWVTESIPVSLHHTALVVMHAWDCGKPGQYPGWRNNCEYHDRADRICREVFPPLLAAIRQSPIPVIHVTMGGTHYFREYAGYKKAVRLAESLPPENPPEQQAVDDPVSLELKDRYVGYPALLGKHNAEDIERGMRNVNFAPNTEPLGDEGIAEDGRQLSALCRHHGINHLIYTGFALNWCLLLSRAGMADMKPRGFLCSVVRDAVTAIENKETARRELCKEVALWRIGLAFGFVFSSGDIINALSKK